MKRTDLAFERPEGLFARRPPEERGSARDEVRLLVTDAEGHHHRRFQELPALLRPGDLMVVNESATIPASLPAEGPLGSILLNVCTRFGERLWLAEPRRSAGEPGPLPLNEGDELRIDGASVRLLRTYPGIPRLWFVRSDRPLDGVVARVGRPIHYGYTDAWPMETYQTLFSRVPGSVEMPSAARPITPRIKAALERQGVRIVPILLHCGVSSLEIEADTVEAQAMYPEAFEVPRATAEAINTTRRHGGRVIAVGTTVVRALESAWTPRGVRAANGFTRTYVHEARGVHALDALLTGFHDPMTTHLALLSALIGIGRVREAYAEAVRQGYLWHEFGDSHLIWEAS